jgi:hypothetical protein
VPQAAPKRAGRQPPAAVALASLLFAGIAMAVSALLWHSYEDVPRTLPVFIGACLAASCASAWLLVRILRPAPRRQAVVFAAIAPILGALWAFLLGIALFKLELTRYVPVEPRTLGAVLLQLGALWVAGAALSAWLFSRPAA